MGNFDWWFWVLVWVIVSALGTAFVAYFLHCCREVSGEDQD